VVNRLLQNQGKKCDKGKNNVIKDRIYWGWGRQRITSGTSIGKTNKETKKRKKKT